MTESLFGAAAAGGSFRENLNRALTFAQGARGTQAPTDAVSAEPVAGLVDDAPAPVAAEVATGVDAPVEQQTDDLADAIRAATVEVEPAAAGVVDDVADAAAPIIDDVADAAVPVAAEAADVPARTGFRSWGPDDIAALFNRGGTAAPVEATAAAPVEAVAAEAAPVADDAASSVASRFGGLGRQLQDAISTARGPAPVEAPAAAVVDNAVAAAAPEAAAATDAAGSVAGRFGGLGSQLSDAITAARGPVVPAAAGGEVAEVVGDAAQAAAKPGLLDRLRDAGAGLGALRQVAESPAAQVVDDAVEGAAKAGPSLVESLRDAAQVALKASPRG